MPPVIILIYLINRISMIFQKCGASTSRLGDQWRVICRTIPEEMLFQIEYITAPGRKLPDEMAA